LTVSVDVIDNNLMRSKIAPRKDALFDATHFKCMQFHASPKRLKGAKLKSKFLHFEISRFLQNSTSVEIKIFENWKKDTKL